MNIRPINHNGHSFLGIDHWHEKGVIHGFLDARVDAKAELPRTEQLLSDSWQRPLAVLRVRQTHSSNLVEVSAEIIAQCGEREADALVADFSATELQSKLLGIITADCVPVLLLSTRSQLRAAAHCGWKGVSSELLVKVIEWFRTQGDGPEDLELALGPCAGPCCYEVGEELINTFGASNLISRGGKTFCDLRQLLRGQAGRAGVPEDQIASSADCTICNSEFFSYRRQKADSGRQLTFIGGSSI